MSDELFKGLGVAVDLKATPGVEDLREKYSDSFRVICETLTRIGIASRKTKTLYQTAHLLHKRGHYRILMFKELFLLDNKVADISDEDLARRNTIVKLLQQWDLLKVLHPEQISNSCPLSCLKVVSFAEKPDWNLVSKYTIGYRKPFQKHQ